MIKQMWIINGEQVTRDKLKLRAIKEGVLIKYPQHTEISIPFSYCLKFLIDAGYDIDVKTEIVND